MQNAPAPGPQAGRTKPAAGGEGVRSEEREALGENDAFIGWGAVEPLNALIQGRVNRKRVKIHVAEGPVSGAKQGTPVLSRV